MSDNFNRRFVHALGVQPQTKASHERIPPELMIATGHDDDVMLFIVRVGDPTATVDALLSIINLAESNLILDNFAKTKGLIQKRIPIDAAQRLKATLADAGTDVEFVLPVDD